MDQRIEDVFSIAVYRDTGWQVDSKLGEADSISLGKVVKEGIGRVSTCFIDSFRVPIR